MLFHFHLTTNATYAYAYPMAEALAAINAAVPSWGEPILLKNYAFYAPIPHEVVARGG